MGRGCCPGSGVLKDDGGLSASEASQERGSENLLLIEVDENYSFSIVMNVVRVLQDRNVGTNLQV